MVEDIKPDSVHKAVCILDTDVDVELVSPAVIEKKESITGNSYKTDENVKIGESSKPVSRPTSARNPYPPNFVPFSGEGYKLA